MLERERFLIRERPMLPGAAVSYDILDPDTAMSVGVARETPGRVTAFLRRFVPRRLTPSRVEVRETEDESLLFSFYRPAGLVQRRVDVFDADDGFLGWCTGGPVTTGDGCRVYNRTGLLFVNALGPVKDAPIRFVTPAGQELGTLSLTGDGPAGPLLALAPVLADQPPAKMLLLATALAFILDLHDRGNSPTGGSP